MPADYGQRRDDSAAGADRAAGTRRIALQSYRRIHLPRGGGAAWTVARERYPRMGDERTHCGRSETIHARHGGADDRAAGGWTFAHGATRVERSRPYDSLVALVL